jgi:hypothetical protein
MDDQNSVSPKVFLRSHVLVAIFINIIVLWDTTTCVFVDFQCRLRGTSCLHVCGRRVCIRFVRNVDTYTQTTRRHIAEDRNLDILHFPP